MVGTLEIQKRLRQAIAPTVGALVFGYFVYHAIQGDRGVISWLQFSQQLAESKARLAELTTERQVIENRVRLLSPESLDPDLLEEQARTMLNVADPNDRLVIVKRGGPAE